MEKSSIKSFKDLDAWKEAHKLVLLIYKLTKNFPSDERFSLTDQLRRAVVSISSNIAEGFSRNTSADKIRFFSMATGSLMETQNQLLISKELGYITSDQYNETETQSIIVSKLINGLIKHLRIHNT